MESFFIAIPHDGLRRFRPPRFWGKRDHLETKFAPQRALKFIVWCKVVIWWKCRIPPSGVGVSGGLWLSYAEAKIVNSAQLNVFAHDNQDGGETSEWPRAGLLLGTDLRNHKFWYRRVPPTNKSFHINVWLPLTSCSTWTCAASVQGCNPEPCTWRRGGELGSDPGRDPGRVAAPHVLYQRYIYIHSHASI